VPSSTITRFKWKW